MSHPQQFVCPITHELMKDPVQDKDGDTYERAAIEEWLRQHHTSPLTRHPMSISDLVPNRALRDAIAQYLQQSGLPLTQQQSSLHPLRTANTAALSSQSPLSLQLLHRRSTGEVLLRIHPTVNKIVRQPMDIVCVVDVSGSMDADAPLKESNTGPSESKGLTVLDVVKHAANTIANVLNDGDRLALVTYSDRATVVSKLTKMTSEGKKAFMTSLASVKADGMTNLWDGLLTAMDLLKASAEPHRVSSVLLLTDGQPNVEPPRGHIPSLERYLDQFGGVPPFTIHTFGFGYNLNSTLLNDIASTSNGMYVFIPDSGLVGTVFVNVLANIQATVATAVTLSVETPLPVASSHMQLKRVAFGAHGCIGSVQYEQSRDFFLCMDMAGTDDKYGMDSNVHAKLTYRFAGNEYSMSADSVDLTPEDEIPFVTAKACDFFCKMVTCLPATPSRELFNNLVATLNAARQPHSALVVGLIKDVSGQVAEALDPTAMNKWGKHYLPSLVRANVLQQCNNFKDFSVQCYGGAFFTSLRDAGEATFVKLPPPVPTKTKTSKGSYVAPPKSMHVYYNCHGGCVLGNCHVALSGGVHTAAENVKRGDVLHNGATVECVVKVRVSEFDLPLMRFPSGLVITEYHPIRINGSWMFPVDAPSAVRSVEDGHHFVYTFLLDREHVLSIDGIEVVALGHDFTGNVVAHSYLGSDKVRNDIRMLKGFHEEGVVVVDGFARDKESNMVAGIRSDSLQLEVPMLVSC